jgi:hypothetical protein
VILAGSGEQESVDGKLSECRFDSPTGMVMHEPSQSLFVAERRGLVRRIVFDKPL